MEICICDDEKKLRRSLRNAVETELQLCGVSYTIKEFSSGRNFCPLFRPRSRISFFWISR